MNKKTIRDVDLTGKRVLVRVDFNVPIQAESPMKDGTVTDDTRIRAALPTIQYILDQHPSRVILMTHLGRPKGKVVPSMSVKPIVPILAELLGREVILAGDCIGERPRKIIDEAPEGSVILLQNTRYYPGDEKNDPEYAAKLATHGEIFVNDAFGVAHRAHASNVGVAQHMEAVAGFLMERELDFLVDALDRPARPFVAIMGGAKIADKAKVIEVLLEKVDRLLIGGGMGITFLKSQGYEVGKSLVDEEALPIVKGLYKAYGSKLVFPTDVVIAKEFKNDSQRDVIRARSGVPADWQILDIGPETVKAFQEILYTAQTVLWNGPLGVFEMPNFAQGTYEIARTLAEITQEGATTIIGGGDSAAAVVQMGLADQMTHISTGGGASLELLEGKSMPGVEVLADR
jgi:phosphoglycerate kinase